MRRKCYAEMARMAEIHEEEGKERKLEEMHQRKVEKMIKSAQGSAAQSQRCGGEAYYSTGNQFERFREFLELISRFEFEFCRRENYFF